MPSRPPTLRPLGRVCAAEGRRLAENARPTARQRGYDRDWERESKAFLAEPGNELCSCGCGRWADTVDHSEPHRGDMAVFWDRTKWRPMFSRCHNRKTAKNDGRWGRARKT